MSDDSKCPSCGGETYDDELWPYTTCSSCGWNSETTDIETARDLWKTTAEKLASTVANMRDLVESAPDLMHDIDNERQPALEDCDQALQCYENTKKEAAEPNQEEPRT